MDGWAIPSWKQDEQAEDEALQIVEKGNCNPNNNEGHMMSEKKSE